MIRQQTLCDGCEVQALGNEISWWRTVVDSRGATRHACSPGCARVVGGRVAADFAADWICPVCQGNKTTGQCPWNERKARYDDAPPCPACNGTGWTAERVELRKPEPID